MFGNCPVDPGDRARDENLASHGLKLLMKKMKEVIDLSIVFVLTK